MLQGLQLLTLLSADIPAVLEDMAEDMFADHGGHSIKRCRQIVKSLQRYQWQLVWDEQEITISQKHARLVRQAFGGLNPPCELSDFTRVPTPETLRSLI